jgi:hypothetical protein
MTKGASSRRENSATANLLVAVTVAIPSALLLIARIHRGLILSPDSLHYLYAATKFSQIGRLLSPDDSPLTLYAPLYPICISIVMNLRISAETSAVLISVTCYVFSSIFTYYLFSKISDNKLLSALGTLSIFLNPDIQTVFSYAWSEHLYLLLSLCLLYTLTAAMVSKREILPLEIAVLGGLAGLAMLDRYSGAALIAATIFVLLMDLRLPLSRRIISAFGVLLVSSLLVLPWLLRNRLADGTLFGQRGLTDDTIVFAVKSISITTGNFLLELEQMRDSRFNMFLGAFFMTVLLFTVLAIIKYSINLYFLLLPALVILISQTFLLVFSDVTTPVDPPNARLLVSIFVPLAFVFVGCVQFFFDQQKIPPGKRRLLIVPLLLTMLVIGNDVRADIISLVAIRPGFINAPAKMVTDEDIPPECRSANTVLYSNKNNYLRYIGIRGPILPLPRRIIYRRAIRDDDWGSFVATVKTHVACLLWVRNGSGIEPSLDDLLGGNADGLSVKKIGESVGLYIYSVQM